MKLLKIKSINKEKKRCHDITVSNNHNFVCNGIMIHNCDYRGEVSVLLLNTGHTPVEIFPGDRIAQLVFVPVSRANFQIVDELSDTSRGAGGWGSTGKS
jgi:deoxyuridine 5'-triphosphate nucleotidohydrolase